MIEVDFVSEFTDSQRVFRQVDTNPKTPSLPWVGPTRWKKNCHFASAPISPRPSCCRTAKFTAPCAALVFAPRKIRIQANSSDCSTPRSSPPTELIKAARPCATAAISAESGWLHALPHARQDGRSLRTNLLPGTQSTIILTGNRLKATHLQIQDAMRDCGVAVTGTRYAVPVIGVLTVNDSRRLIAEVHQRLLCGKHPVNPY